jgi:hypothetical protein
MEELRNARKILVGKPGDGVQLGVYRRIILKRIS